MQYGLGLTYIKQQNFSLAEKLFQQLKIRFPKQREYQTALAQVALHQQDFATAKKRYLALQQTFPGNVEFQFAYIDILLQTKETKLARQHLKLLDYETQHYPRYYLLLAQAYGDSGKTTNSHRYMAEYYYSIGLTNAAIQQIELAQKAKDLNFYLSSILEDRLNFFAAELRALKQLQE